MKLLCWDCDSVTRHQFVGSNPDNGMDLYQCVQCDGRQEVETKENEMEHYDHLITKALINRGGSSSETYVYQLLTGDVKEDCSSVARMWGYLDTPLQSKLVSIFDEVCGVSIAGLSDADVVKVLIEHMAEKAGRREFFDNTPRDVIDRMSDDEYEGEINDAIQQKRHMLMMKS